MAEGDTQTTPDTGTVEAAAGDATQQTVQADGSATEAQQTDTGGEPATTTTEPQAQPQPQINPEQIIEQVSQRMTSWMGRREKERNEALFGQIAQMLDTRIPKQQPASTPVFDGKIDAASLLDKPGEVLNQLKQSILNEIPGVLTATQQRQTQAEQKFVTDAITQAGSIMESNPMFSGDEGGKLGNEVVNEIVKSTNTLDRNLPPAVAGRLAVSEALMRVVQRRSSVKTNAFTGKQPMGKGQGTLNSPTLPVNKPAPIKLDPAAAQVAAYFGNSEEEIQNFLGSKK